MRKKRILIVDDEKGFTHMLKLNLEKTGEYEVYTENSGAKGLEAAKEVKPDIIFLDIIMPDMPGNQVAAQLETEPDLKHIPIVFVTALVSKNEAVTDSCTISGRPFMAKPIGIEDIRDCIQRELSHKILIIDDDIDIVRLMSGRLKSAGYRVQQASTGEEALKELNESPPDLVIVDLILPGKSGWDISQQLRSNERFKDVKIIVLSGMIEEDGAGDGPLEQADFFMRKPYDGNLLLEKVGELLKDA